MGTVHAATTDMTPPNEYKVSLQIAAPRLIAAVHARLPTEAVPGTFGRYLDQVYAAAQRGAVQLDGQNVFVYQDVPEWPKLAYVGFGVGVTAPFAAVGAVRPTQLPTGEVAMTTHVGSYARLGAAHDAIRDWCRTHGHPLTGQRWEVYGHWADDEAELRTDVLYLIER